MNEKILITGADGFIGSHLTKALEEKGYDIVKFSGDIRNKTDIDLPMRNGIDGVIHLAAILPYVGATQLYYHEVNVEGTKNLLSAAVRCGVKKFIYASTISVYSEPTPQSAANRVNVFEESSPPAPGTTYGKTKREAEVACLLHFDEIDITILRYSGVYGVGQHEHEAPYRFTRQALDNKPITIHGDGTQSSDFTYIDDVVIGTILAYEKNVPGIYNLSSGEETSINKLADTILTLSNSKSDVVYVDNTDRPFRFVADTAKAVSVFGYKPRTLASGLRKYICKIRT